MPIYEYECNECGAVQETIMGRDADTPACSSCGGRDLSRRFSSFAVGTSRDPGTFCQKYPEHCTACPSKQELCPLPE